MYITKKICWIRQVPAMQQPIQRPGREGGEKHEIYVAVFGHHLFYDLFLQVRGWPSRPPGSATAIIDKRCGEIFKQFMLELIL